jgi:hypothetical protein
MCGMQRREPPAEISATAGRAHGSGERRHPSHDTTAKHGRRWVSSAPGQGKRALQSVRIDRHHACVKLKSFRKFLCSQTAWGGEVRCGVPDGKPAGRRGVRGDRLPLRGSDPWATEKGQQPHTTKSENDSTHEDITHKKHLQKDNPETLKQPRGTSHMMTILPTRERLACLSYTEVMSEGRPPLVRFFFFTPLCCIGPGRGPDVLAL